MENEVYTLHEEMNAEFRRMSSLTDEQQEQLDTFTVDVEALKNQIYGSVVDINDQIQLVSTEI